jgi:two-component system chemotaxis response regulator CheB
MPSIKVYVVDDSAVVRQTLAHLLAGDPELELIGSAPNPLVAMDAIRKIRPDVMLLDIEMPGMDGLTFLRQIMRSDPIPTVICSTLTAPRAARWRWTRSRPAPSPWWRKPASSGSSSFWKIRAANSPRPSRAAARSRPRSSCRAMVPCRQGATAARGQRRSVRFHMASTVHALCGQQAGGDRQFDGRYAGAGAGADRLPPDAPGIAITQHMPEKFTAMYAERLNGVCAINVREARDGDRLERGARPDRPGGKPPAAAQGRGQYYVVVADGPPVNRHKPSVDVLFKLGGGLCRPRHVLGMILTGMGDDGARGMKTAARWRRAHDCSE